MFESLTLEGQSRHTRTVVECRVNRTATAGAREANRAERRIYRPEKETTDSVVPEGPGMHQRCNDEGYAHWYVDVVKELVARTSREDSQTDHEGQREPSDL